MPKGSEGLASFEETWLQAVPKTVLERLRSCPDLVRHGLVVAHLSVAVAAILNMKHQDTQHLVMAALVHDIGKSLWPTAIRRAPFLRYDSLMLHLRHPQMGAAMLANLWPTAPEPVLRAVAGHHNRPGQPAPDMGYGLEPLATILGAIDLYAALGEARPDRRRAIPRWERPRLLQAAGMPAQVVEALARRSLSAWGGDTAADFLVISGDAAGAFAPGAHPEAGQDDNPKPDS